MKPKKHTYDLSQDSIEKLLEVHEGYNMTMWKYQMEFTKKEIEEELARRGIENPVDHYKDVYGNIRKKRPSAG